jgi:hypothetical protein
MKNKIISAIRNRNYIYVEDDKQELRRVEPHCLYNPKGRDMLICWQEAGHSDSGEKAGWKQIALEKIVKFNYTPYRFQVRPDFKPERYINVEAVVQ